MQSVKTNAPGRVSRAHEANISVRIPIELYEVLREEADANDAPISWAIRRALTKALARRLSSRTEASA